MASHKALESLSTSLPLINLLDELLVSFPSQYQGLVWVAGWRFVAGRPLSGKPVPLLLTR